MKGNMADYFTNFSLILPLNKKQQEYAVELANRADHHRCDDEPLPADFPEQLKDLMENWTFETEATQDGIWLHSEYGGIDAVCAFIQLLLQKFNPKDSVAFEW